MGQEIERKFLVDHEKWSALQKPLGETYRQGYITTDPEKVIRVRLTDESGYLTIKGLSVGATRAEFEYTIPRSDAIELLDKFSIAELSKKRYKISIANKLWEIDEFTGRNSGLIVAEIELSSKSEEFELPDWIEKEVTGDDRYYNSNLTLRPFKSWNQ